MKLFVQIPCLNEEATLASVIRDIPRNIEGVDEVRVLVIDDGSADRTAEVAHREGADYVLRLPYTQGLAKAFTAGIDKCLELGADIVVNTDGDHQYEGADIPVLIHPILEKKADMVIGDRQASELAHFTFLKRKLQKLGSRTVSVLSGMKIPDATSGFRAYSRDAALRLNVFSRFSYTLETVIQAGKNHVAVMHVPVQANEPARKSRLYSNLATYIKRSASTIIRIYALYEPLRTFFYVGGAIFLIGALGVIRFLFVWFQGQGQGHVQSLIISAALLIIGFQIWMLGIIADLISVNRRLSEEVLYRMRKRTMSLEDKDTVRSQRERKGASSVEEAAHDPDSAAGPSDPSRHQTKSRTTIVSLLDDEEAPTTRRAR